MKTFDKIGINLMLSNLLPNVRDIGEMYASPKRKITCIAKSYTNGFWRRPCSWLELECGHTHKPVRRRDLTESEKLDGEHDENTHLAKPGMLIGCPRCVIYAKKLEALKALKALKPGDVSHSRFRTRDSRGIGDGDLYVYKPDSTSPTGVTFLMSIEDTPEAHEVLRKLCASALSPTETR